MDFYEELKGRKNCHYCNKWQFPVLCAEFFGLHHQVLNTEWHDSYSSLSFLASFPDSERETRFKKLQLAKEVFETKSFHQYFKEALSVAMPVRWINRYTSFLQARDAIWEFCSVAKWWKVQKICSSTGKPTVKFWWKPDFSAQHSKIGQCRCLRRRTGKCRLEQCWKSWSCPSGNDEIRPEATKNGWSRRECRRVEQVDWHETKKPEVTDCWILTLLWY